MNPLFKTNPKQSPVTNLVPLVTRLTSYVIFTVAVVVFPWWVAVVITIFFIFLFSHYVEALVVGWFLDGVFATPVPHLANFQFFFLAFFMVSIVIVEYAKDRLRIYHVS